MAQTYQTLRDASSNTGLKIRLDSRVVSGQTVHENYQRLIDPTNDTEVRILAANSASADAGIVTRPTPFIGGTAFSSSSRAAGTYTADLANAGAGMELFLDVTVVAAGGSVLVTIQTKDPVSGQYVSVLAGTAMVAAGTNRMRVYPGVAAAANLSASDVLGAIVRVQAVVSVNNVTFSVGYYSIP